MPQHSRCPKCAGNTFGTEMIAVKNLNVNVCMIYCAACFTAISVFDASMHDKINKVMEALKIKGYDE